MYSQMTHDQWICSTEITSSSATNLRVTKGLSGSGSLEELVEMYVNWFEIFRGISRSMCKLVRTPTVKKKNT